MEQTVEKMMRVVRADTGGSRVYADMLLSLLNKNHKVDIGYWCWKADRDDFRAVLEFMANSRGDEFWEFEKLVMPYRDELLQYVSDEQK